MQWIKASVTAAWLVAGAVPPLLAGVVIVVDSEILTPKGAAGTATVYLDGKRLRIDSTEGGGDYTVLYRKDDNDQPGYWLIDRRESTYVEVSYEDMQRTRAQVEKSRQAVGRQIKNLTPERRRQMQALYERPLEELAQDPAPPEYKRVATGIPLGKWSCDQYEGYRDGKKVEEVWAVGWAVLGIKRSDLAIFGEMAEMFEGIGQKLPAFFSFAKEDVTGVEDFPVMVVAYQNGVPAEKSRLREVRRERIDPQLFELPEGLTKQSIGQQR